MSREVGLERVHFLTEAQYAQESIKDSDIYAVKMDGITPGEVVIKGFQGGLEVQLTAAQKQAARDWFGIGVNVTSTDPTLKEVGIINGDLLNCYVKTITVDGETFKVLAVD